jgi:hypothetical protein
MLRMGWSEAGRRHQENIDARARVAAAGIIPTSTTVKAKRPPRVRLTDRVDLPALRKTPLRFELSGRGWLVLDAIVAAKDMCSRQDLRNLCIASDANDHMDRAAKLLKVLLCEIKNELTLHGFSLTAIKYESRNGDKIDGRAVLGHGICGDKEKLRALLDGENTNRSSPAKRKYENIFCLTAA